jgi:cytochrome P450
MLQRVILCRTWKISLMKCSLFSLRLQIRPGMPWITYFVVSNPEIYRTLTAEFKAAFPDRTDHLDYMCLDKLPYLTAVIKEGLRLSYGTPGRLTRMVEIPEATFNGYTVPRGTIVGMSSWMVHRDPTIWPEPERFLPERWLDPAQAKKLEKYFVSFSKGSRQCIGMQYESLLPLHSMSLTLHEAL